MLARYRQYLGDARETLMAGRKLSESARRHVKAALGHVLDFHVWRSLVIEQGLDGSEGVDLICLLVAGAARSKLGQSRSDDTRTKIRSAMQSIGG